MDSEMHLLQIKSRHKSKNARKLTRPIFYLRKTGLNGLRLSLLYLSQTKGDIIHLSTWGSVSMPSDVLVVSTEAC